MGPTADRVFVEATLRMAALFPERQIDFRRDPELARAAEVVIERREAAPGWEQTEWVEANLIAYYARLLVVISD